LDLSIEKCGQIVNFEAYSLAAVLCITSSIMLLRVHALWDQRIWVGAISGAIVAVEIGILFYLASFGEGAYARLQACSLSRRSAAPLNPIGITGCLWSNVRTLLDVSRRG
jgi:hypothetical protein